MSVVRSTRLLQLLIMGHFITLLGSSLSRFALGVWAFQRQGKVIDFALVLVSGFLPNILISPMAGYLADKKGYRSSLLSGDALGCVGIGYALVRSVYGTLGLPDLIMISVVLSLSTAAQSPALMMAVRFLAPPDRLSKWNGVVSTASSLTDFIGPILGGTILAGLGMRAVFVFDICSYLVAMAITVGFWQYWVAASKPSGEAEHFLADVTRGFAHIRQQPALLFLIAFFTLVNFVQGIASVLGQPLALSLMPVAKLGWANGIFGASMTLGALVVSLVKLPANRVAFILICCALYGAGVSLQAGSTSFLWLTVCWSLGGVLIPFINDAIVTVIQELTPADILGRVYTVGRALAWTTLPLAQLLAGLAVDKVPTRFSAAVFRAVAPAFVPLRSAPQTLGLRLVLVLGGMLLIGASLVSLLYTSLRTRVVDEKPAS